MSNTQGIGASQANGQQSSGGNEAQSKTDPRNANFHEGHEDKEDADEVELGTGNGGTCSCPPFFDFVSCVFFVNDPFFIERIASIPTCRRCRN
jgi:hypothetical protein